MSAAVAAQIAAGSGAVNARKRPRWISFIAGGTAICRS
jgi:hypothetical protein